MTPSERKHAFRVQAAIDARTLYDAARLGCGLSWTHVNTALRHPQMVSEAARERIATYLGRSVDDVFGEEARAGAA